MATITTRTLGDDIRQRRQATAIGELSDENAGQRRGRLAVRELLGQSADEVGVVTSSICNDNQHGRATQQPRTTWFSAWLSDESQQWLRSLAKGLGFLFWGTVAGLLYLMPLFWVLITIGVWRLTKPAPGRGVTRRATSAWLRVLALAQCPLLILAGVSRIPQLNTYSHVLPLVSLLVYMIAFVSLYIVLGIHLRSLAATLDDAELGQAVRSLPFVVATAYLLSFAFLALGLLVEHAEPAAGYLSKGVVWLALFWYAKDLRRARIRIRDICDEIVMCAAAQRRSEAGVTLSAGDA